MDPVPRSTEKQKHAIALIQQGSSSTSSNSTSPTTTTEHPNRKLLPLPSPVTDAQHMARFTRGLLVEPVHIPWEMTVPLPDATELERKLKPSIRTNMGLFRDHLAHAQHMRWPRYANKRPLRKTDRRNILQEHPQ